VEYDQTKTPARNVAESLAGPSDEVIAAQAEDCAFELTPKLRFVVRQPIDDGTLWARMLQQGWRHRETGDIHWRDVPLST
jgi:hypothetical protein